jgi:hypothetical protein
MKTNGSDKTQAYGRYVSLREMGSMARTGELETRGPGKSPVLLEEQQALDLILGRKMGWIDTQCGPHRIKSALQEWSNSKFGCWTNAIMDIEQVLAKNWAWFLENPDRMDDPLLHQRRNVSKWLVEAKATMPSGYLRQAVDEIEGQLGKVIEPTVEPSDQSWCPLAVEPLWSTLTSMTDPDDSPHPELMADTAKSKKNRRKKKGKKEEVQHLGGEDSAETTNADVDGGEFGSTFPYACGLGDSE